MRRGGVPLIAVGVWLPGCGFTRVLSSVLSRLADEYDIHYVGIGYKGPLRDIAGITLHPCNLRGGDIFGVAATAELCDVLDAHIVLLLNDLWVLHSYVPRLHRYKRSAAIVAYVPLDGRLPDDRLLEPLGGIDRFVAYSGFGRAEIAASLQRLKRGGRAFTDADVAVIPHGVDTDAFHPLAGTVDANLRGGRHEARLRLFPGEPDWHDAFIVLNANRPIGRKRVDLSLEAFACFAQGKPANVKLWLHHAIMNAEERAAIVAHADRLGIGTRLRLTSLDAPPLEDAQLNLVYNACDVGMNTAMGEGWGLVSFEHGATGAAQIVPHHSACAELWANAAEVVPTRDVGVPNCAALEMSVVSPADVAAALDRLYADHDHLRQLSHAAYRNAVQPAYRWDAIAAQWRRLFREVLAGHQAPGAVAAA